MRSTSARFLAALGCLLAPAWALGEEPSPAPSRANPGATEDARGGAAEKPPAADKDGSRTKGADEGTPDAEAADPALAAAILAETRKRLDALAPPEGKAEPAASRALREVLGERITWIEEWKKAAKERRDAEHPEKSPEREAGRLKADLERVRGALDRSARDPLVLLPRAFQAGVGKVSAAASAEMKDTIDAAQAELKAATAELEASRADPARGGAAPIAALRAERDRIHQRCATLDARKAERQAALADSDSSEARDLARERLINFEWEARVEAERLKAKEAQIDLEDRRARNDGPRLQWLEDRRELARRTLEVMQSRYRVFIDRQQSDLKAEAEDEQVRADTAFDPLEKFRAKRSAEILALRALLLKDEQEKSEGPTLLCEVHKDLADRAERDFEKLKRLVEERRASALVALRLRNDYKRLDLEIALISRTELARAADMLTLCENALAAVELDIINDAREDRFLLDDLLKALPEGRRSEARTVATALEKEHRLVLEKRRAAREVLADHAHEMHKQILRRLKVLQEQYAYVRTHIFWMRDAEPIGPSTLAQVPGDARRLIRTVFQIAGQVGNRVAWGRISPEFLASMLAVLALPWPLVRARAALAAHLDADCRSQARPPA